MSFEIDKHKENQNEESFQDMLERSLQSQSYFSIGERITAPVVSITTENIFVNLGGKKEGFIKAVEFIDENNQLTIQIGDEVEAFFDGVEDGLMRFTTLINGISSGTLNYLQNIAKTGDAIEGKIERQNKGGFEVIIKGLRAFCPISQIDLKPVKDKSIFEGKTFSFKIVDFKENGKNIIVSRRALLEEEKRAKIEALRSKITEGAVIECPVKSVNNFGLLVDLGDIVGLIPSSEISWGRNQDLSSLFTEGQLVKAVVLKVDFDAEKITLSIKSLYEDPWIKIEEKYPVGSKVSGNISKIMPFGAFMNLEDCIEGLIHISNLGVGRRIKHPEEVLSKGQFVEAYVLSIDKDHKKLSLTLKSPEKIEVIYPNEGDIISVTISKLMPFGILARISEGLTGLIPNTETGLNKGEDMKNAYPEGKVVNVVVQEVDKEKTRVRLSIKDYLAKKETDEYRKFIKEQDLKTDKVISDFGALLQAKLQEKQLKA